MMAPKKPKQAFLLLREHVIASSLER